MCQMLLFWSLLQLCDIYEEPLALGQCNDFAKTYGRPLCQCSKENILIQPVYGQGGYFRKNTIQLTNTVSPSRFANLSLTTNRFIPHEDFAINARHAKSLLRYQMNFFAHQEVATSGLKADKDVSKGVFHHGLAIFMCKTLKTEGDNDKRCIADMVEVLQKVQPVTTSDQQISCQGSRLLRKSLPSH